MHRYIPNAQSDKEKMLQAMGAESIESLFVDIPAQLRMDRDLDLEPAYSEMEIARRMGELASKNVGTDQLVSFLGAGAYDHFVPTVVNHMSGRSEFFTAYTPYQPEISQGTLTTIFEYQSMICELTGMDVANASLYDGSNACVEAAMLSCNLSKKKKRFLVSTTVNPEYREVMHTYFKFRDFELEEIPMKDGETDYEAMADMLDKDVAGVLVQSPNFFGVIEDVERTCAMTKEHKAVSIVSVDPISLALLKPPGELGADIVIGEGQSLGNDLNLGGPYLGFFATTNKLVRKIPGRICGQSVDADGQRAFVLTLQAREQHIRRFKATSNICSNQGLIVTRATMYMAAMGKEGMRDVAGQSFQKAQYLYNKLIATGKFEPVFQKPFFKEFALKAKKPVAEINAALLEKGFLGGFDLNTKYPMENTVLLAVTEKRSKAEMDKFVELMEVIG